MNRLRLLLCVIIGLGYFCPKLLLAQSTDLSYNLLAYPSTTKALALGGVTTSLIDNDIALAYDSPALFGKEQNGQLSVSYANLMRLAHLSSVAYGQSFKERNSWAIGIKSLNYMPFVGRDHLGNATGNFYVNELLVQTSYSYELTDYLRLGVSLKGLYSSLGEYKSYGIATDFGLNYFTEDKECSVGLSVHNLGSVFHPYLTDKTQATPWDIHLGLSRKFAYAPFYIHLTAYHLRPKLAREFTPSDLGFGRKVLRHLTIGVEYSLNKYFWLAMGYNPRIAQDYEVLRGSKLSGISCGLGFNQSSYRVSLSVRAYDSSFWAVMTTFSTDFGLFNRSK